ncbi:MAG: hypothetical protein OER12_06765, partial [Acidimicrobiia bacterium]|nr:hypothetical protein [Acidimicrobiia bacterium]
VGPAAVLALAMAAFVPASAEALVPVPRALNRRVRFGVDPALELARAVGRLTGLPVHQALRPPAWRSHHAGKRRDRRAPVTFVRVGQPKPGMIIVDDVITTGATLAAAGAALGGEQQAAIVATNAGV